MIFKNLMCITDNLDYNEINSFRLAGKDNVVRTNSLDLGNGRRVLPALGQNKGTQIVRRVVDRGSSPMYLAMPTGGDADMFGSLGPDTDGFWTDFYVFGSGEYVKCLKYVEGKWFRGLYASLSGINKSSWSNNATDWAALSVYLNDVEFFEGNYYFGSYGLASYIYKMNADMTVNLSKPYGLSGDVYLASGGGRLVGLTASGKVTRSDDFNSTVTLLYGGYHSLSYWDGLFVAMGSESIASSADGVVWDEVRTGKSNLFMAASSSQLIMLRGDSSDGSKFALWSTTDGLSYRLLPQVEGVCNGLDFQGGYFWLSCNGSLKRSTNGESWSSVSLSGSWKSVVYTGSVFVAVSIDGKYSTSSDGVSWFAPTSFVSLVNFGSGIRSVATGDGLVKVVVDMATGDAGIRMYSYNGLSWGYSNLPVKQVSYGDGIFMAVGSAAFSSDDGGASWVELSLPVSQAFFRGQVYYADGSFYTSAQSSWYKTSDAGLSWVEVDRFDFVGEFAGEAFASRLGRVWNFGNGSISSTLGWLSHASGLGSIYGVNGTRTILTNSGGDWLAVDGGSVFGEAVTFSGDRFMSSSGQNILVSTNGVTWGDVEITSSSSPLQRKCAYGFALASPQFEFLYSKDRGDSWSVANNSLHWVRGVAQYISSGVSSYVYWIEEEGKFFYLTADGPMLSSDGINWVSGGGAGLSLSDGGYNDVVYIPSLRKIVRINGPFRYEYDFSTGISAVSPASFPGMTAPVNIGFRLAKDQGKVVYVGGNGSGFSRPVLGFSSSDGVVWDTLFTAVQWNNFLNGATLSARAYFYIQKSSTHVVLCAPVVNTDPAVAVLSNDNFASVRIENVTVDSLEVPSSQFIPSITKIVSDFSTSAFQSGNRILYTSDGSNWRSVRMVDENGGGVFGMGVYDLILEGNSGWRIGSVGMGA